MGVINFEEAKRKKDLISELVNLYTTYINNNKENFFKNLTSDFLDELDTLSLEELEDELDNYFCECCAEEAWDVITENSNSNRELRDKILERIGNIYFTLLENGDGEEVIKEVLEDYENDLLTKDIEILQDEYIAMIQEVKEFEESKVNEKTN